MALSYLCDTQGRKLAGQLMVWLWRLREHVRAREVSWSLLRVDEATRAGEITR